MTDGNVSIPIVQPKTSSNRLDKFYYFYAFALAFFLVFCFARSSDQIQNAPATMALLLLNGLLATYGQFRAMRVKASLNFVSFVFCYLFMAIAPLVQIGAADQDPVFKMDNVVFIAALNALAFISIGIFYTLKLKLKADSQDVAGPRKSRRYALLFITSFTVALTALVVFRETLFSSRESFSHAFSHIFPDTPTALLAITILQSLPFFGAALGLRAALRDRRTGWIFLYSVLFLIAGILNNPTINPRFKLAGLAFFFIDYIFRGKNLKLLALLLFLGIGLAPLFNSFRYEATDTNTGASQHRLFEDTFLSYDYDAFLTSSYAVVKVDQDGINWGTNIIGSVLFFVPRALWTGKPRQTSFIIYDTMSKYRFVGTDNLSTPLMAEGYLSFAWAGALLISLVYWLTISKMVQKSYQDSDSLLFLFRCVFTGLVLIFLRGTLTIGMSAVAGSFVSAAIPWYLFTRAQNKSLPKPLISGNVFRPTSK